ncbi:MAG TPA: amino acid adenylation domain-containing protein, partial [Candidatus Deferrimicrobium sp.]|nr:amino acid adenylation domain-containing protein [Candidatus Deferrimicrobium sp.]
TGCRRPDGNIDFLGRKDYQVKIRGFRIELGEIESTLNRFPGIEQTVVVAKAYKDGNKYLCAYFISTRGANISDMKAYLAERLPYYMIPAHFTALKELPLTPNGKVDREALRNVELDKEVPMESINEETLKRFVSPFFSQVDRPATVEQEPVDMSHEELSHEERKQILEDFNNTGAGYPKYETVHRVFEVQVEKTPDRIALTYEDKQMTYRELNERSNLLAAELWAHGVKAGDIVGLMVERSLEMLTALWAILKVGGAYLPIGDENPPERVQFMLEDSRVEIILGDSVQGTSGYKRKFLDINAITYSNHDGSNLQPISTAGDLAYVIYTSGTTGIPKGVMIENRSLINFIKGMTDIIDFNESSLILSLITISFDIFFLETLLPLTRGSRVVIGNKKSQADVTAAGKLLKKENITTFQCTPTMLQRIAADEEAVTGLRQLKYLLVGGEIFREALYENIQSKTNGKIFNLYGPTETTVWSTAKHISGTDSLNIGKPIANTRIYILNERDELCPIGMSGELCIGGDGVARGYLNNPELTAERFKFNMSYRSYKTYIFYKTGDMARWLPDGDIEFLGRRDQQIKINGIRIELAEIENILLRHEDIDEAVVISKEKSPGNFVLCAYLVSQKRLWETEIRTYLSGKVPTYMIPTQFVHLEKIPLTPSGKIDRKLLTAVNIAANETYTAPRNELERKIKEIWETNLGIENIGIKDNFFSIGGDSIKSIGLVNTLNREFAANLKIRDLFQNETIEKLAEKIGQPETGAPPSSTQYDQALQELEAVKNKFMKRKAK